MGQWPCNHEFSDDENQQYLSIDTKELVLICCHLNLVGGLRM